MKSNLRRNHVKYSTEQRISFCVFDNIVFNNDNSYPSNHGRGSENTCTVCMSICFYSCTGSGAT